MSANDIPAVVRQLSQPGLIELGAFPAEAQGAKVSDLDAAVVEQLRVLREDYERAKACLLDAHMSKNYPGFRSRWSLAKRASLEVASWPEWKRRACYGQAYGRGSGGEGEGVPIA